MVGEYELLRAYDAFGDSKSQLVDVRVSNKVW